MEDERDVMEVDVLFVGGGIACLSGAIHLSNMIRKHNEKVDQAGEGEKLDEVMIAILEKGAYPGSHHLLNHDSHLFTEIDETALGSVLDRVRSEGGGIDFGHGVEQRVQTVLFAALISQE